MKKLLFIAVMLCAAYCSQAQSTASSKKQLRKDKKADNKEMRQLRKEIRATSKTSFAKDFKNVTQITWSTDSVFDVVSFSSAGKTMEAYYDETGTLVGTLTYISFTSLPEKSRKQIKKDYKNYKVKNAISYDDNENNNTSIVLYGTTLNQDDYFLDVSDGTEDIMLLITLSGDIMYLGTL